MALVFNGGFGTVYSLGQSQDFVGNSLLYNGASAGFGPIHCERNQHKKLELIHNFSYSCYGCYRKRVFIQNFNRLQIQV